MATKTYDLLTMGRSSIDLYSNDIGAPFVDIKSFAAYVGGSPTNIAVGARAWVSRPPCSPASAPIRWEILSSTSSSRKALPRNLFRANPVIAPVPSC